MELSREAIVEEVVSRLNRAKNNKMMRGSEMNQFGYHSVIQSAYDFYRGIEYELNELLDWLGYEGD